MKIAGFIVLSSLVLGATCLYQSNIVFAGEAPNAFSRPSAKYLSRFEKPGRKIFVLEHFDTSGAFLRRDVDPLTAPVKFPSAVERVINGKTFVLRGLTNCPNRIVSVMGMDNAPCEKAAREVLANGYSHHSVDLCKTIDAQPPDRQQCLFPVLAYLCPADMATREVNIMSLMMMTAWYSWASRALVRMPVAISGGPILPVAPN